MAINPIHGTTGNDELISLLGADRIQGRAGNDSFVFTAGTLSSTMTYGSIDHIIDFRGAGTSGSGEQDLLVFRGFSEGSTLVFDHFGADRVWDADLGAYKLVENRKMQYYRVVDNDNPVMGGYVLVQTNSDATLTADDVVFEPGHKDVVVDFEDLGPVGSGHPLDEGYKGFNWNVPQHEGGNNDAYVLEGGAHPLPSGYTVNGTNLAYTPFASDPLMVTLSNGGDFTFKGFDVLSAWDDAEQVDIPGYLDGVLIGSYSLTVTDTMISHIDVSWGTIDQLVISASAQHLVMDNFHFQV